MSKTLYLVSCTKSKLDGSAPSKDLYAVSDWFRKARAYVEPKGPWLILSAKHGLLEPEKMIEPYEESLKGKSRAERSAWAARVGEELLDLTEPGDRIIFLAGLVYREFLQQLLEDSGRLVDVPMRGLLDGQQRQWLARKLSEEGITIPLRPRTAAGKQSHYRTNSSAKKKRRAGMSLEERLQDLQTFYLLLGELGAGLGGARLLGDCHSGMEWPERGVYFFFEDGEERTDSGVGSRVVRVGTHALGQGKKTLWQRLRNHRGAEHGGGHHRGSVFRALVGASLSNQDPSLAVEGWDFKKSESPETREKERALEVLTSKTLGSMPLLWLAVHDESSAESLRGHIERNSIALLSNSGVHLPLDPPSQKWLGHYSPTKKVRKSGLWNSKHVNDCYDRSFLDVLRELVTAQLEGRAHLAEDLRGRSPTSFPSLIETTRTQEATNRMGQIDEVLSYIKANKPQCDDCINEKLGYSHRQTVNALARRLQEAGKVTRRKGTCNLCKLSKKVTSPVQL